jgi:phenylacetate-CoA ligase
MSPVARTPLEAWVARRVGCAGSALTRASIAAYQLERLNEVVRYAMERSPFYRERLSSFRTPALASLAEIGRLPFTDSEDLRLRGNSMACVSRSAVARVVSLESSGTSGEPKRVFFTEADQELTIDFFGVGMSTLVGAGDRVLILLPGERPGCVGDLLAAGLRRIGATAIPHGFVRDAGETLDLMARERVTSLVAIPVHARALAEVWRDRRIASGPAMGAPRSCLLSMDSAPKSLVRGLQEAWGCDVFDHYGMTEMGLGGGVECAAHEGYHLREADLYVEVVDPKTGESLADGESGEVAFTTLTREGMPFIRYRTGDLSRFIPEPCPCGSVLRRLARIEGRKGGPVAIGEGVRLAMADLDEALFALRGILDFSASVGTENGGRRLRIEAFVSDGESVPSKPEILAALRRIRGSFAIEVAISERGSCRVSHGEKRTIRAS